MSNYKLILWCLRRLSAWVGKSVGPMWTFHFFQYFWIVMHFSPLRNHILFFFFQRIQSCYYCNNITINIKTVSGWQFDTEISRGAESRWSDIQSGSHYKVLWSVRCLTACRPRATWCFLLTVVIHRHWHYGCRPNALYAMWPYITDKEACPAHR